MISTDFSIFLQKKGASEHWLAQRFQLNLRRKAFRAWFYPAKIFNILPFQLLSCPLNFREKRLLPIFEKYDHICILTVIKNVIMMQVFINMGAFSTPLFESRAIDIKSFSLYKENLLDLQQKFSQYSQILTSYV